MDDVLGLNHGETDVEIMENFSMQLAMKTLEIEYIPQCVDCSYNKGAIACEIFGEKPSEYMLNEKDCPRQ